MKVCVGRDVRDFLVSSDSIDYGHCLMAAVNGEMRWEAVLGGVCPLYTCCMCGMCGTRLDVCAVLEQWSVVELVC